MSQLLLRIQPLDSKKVQQFKQTTYDITVKLGDVKATDEIIDNTNDMQTISDEKERTWNDNDSIHTVQRNESNMTQTYYSNFMNGDEQQQSETQTLIKSTLERNKDVQPKSS